jgi:hypothetical protein
MNIVMIQSEIAQLDTLAADSDDVKQLTTALAKEKEDFQRYLDVGRKKISHALFSCLPGDFTAADAVDGIYEHYPEEGRYGHPVALGDSAEDCPVDQILMFCTIAEEKKTLIWEACGKDPTMLERVPSNWETTGWRDMTVKDGVLRSRHIESSRTTEPVKEARDAYAKELQFKGKAVPKVGSRRSYYFTFTTVITALSAVITALFRLLLH